MRIAGIQYRRRKQIRDGKVVDVFRNDDIGIPSFSVRLWDRITFNSSHPLRPVVRLAKNWTWRP
jgi:ssDNA-binding replication factor A large subunit